MGGVGLVACLLDWGAVGGLEIPNLDVARQIELHPTQFSEVAAICAQWCLRLNRIPKYISIADAGEADRWITLPLGGMSSKPIFDEFDAETYGRLLAAFTGNDLDAVWYRDTDQLWTTLTTPEGKPLQVTSADDIGFRPPARP